MPLSETLRKAQFWRTFAIRTLVFFATLLLINYGMRSSDEVFEWKAEVFNKLISALIFGFFQAWYQLRQQAPSRQSDLHYDDIRNGILEIQSKGPLSYFVFFTVIFLLLVIAGGLLVGVITLVFLMLGEPVADTGTTLLRMAFTFGALSLLLTLYDFIRDRIRLQRLMKKR